MRGRHLGSILAVAAATAVALAWSAVPAVGQASKNRPVVAGCPSVSAKFHQCALEKARAFTPPKTPDGTPDLQGIWSAPLAQGFQNVEDYPGNPRPGGFGPAVTMVVDPADGRVPSTPGRVRSVTRTSRGTSIRTPSASRRVSPGRWATSARGRSPSLET